MCGHASAVSRMPARAHIGPCPGRDMALSAAYGPVGGRSLHDPPVVHNNIYKASYAEASRVRHVAGASGTRERTPGRGNDVADLVSKPFKPLPK
jgi:hypothetical protein